MAIEKTPTHYKSFASILAATVITLGLAEASGCSVESLDCYGTSAKQAANGEYTFGVLVHGMPPGPDVYAYQVAGQQSRNLESILTIPSGQLALANSDQPIVPEIINTNTKEVLAICPPAHIVQK